MRYLRRIDPFDSLITGKFITFVGAGGKTSLAEYLAREALKRGKRVALATTTKIWARKPFVTLDESRWQDRPEKIIRIGKTVEAGKLTGLDDAEIMEIGRGFDLVLIEGDGSKGMPLKYPAAFEPVIPVFSDKVVVVGGLDALTGQVAQNVFRWNLFADEAEVRGDDIVTPAIFSRLFEADAMMKGVSADKCAVVLNKYDICRNRRDALDIARSLYDHACCPDVILASAKLGFFYSLG